MEIIRSKVKAFLNCFTEGLSLLMSSVGANQMMIKMKWFGWGEEKKDRSDGSRDVRVGSTTTSRDVRVGVSLAALIRGHRRLRHRRTTLHFFYTQTECFVECREYIVFLHYIIAQCTGAADIVQLYNSSTQVRQSTISLHCIAGK